MIIEHPSPKDLLEAARSLKEGHLVAFPTETVYGLGADAENTFAVNRIFETKGRPKDHPLIVHVANLESVHHFASDVPPFAQALMSTFWPGPLTLILQKRHDVANASSGGHASIGLRMPSHPMALDLLLACQRLGIWGLAAPSANRFGRVSPTKASHVLEEFNSTLMILNGGNCDIGIESTIIDCTRGQPILLRPGQLSVCDIEKILGQRVHLQLIDQDLTSSPESDQLSAAPKASGRLLSHYAPSAKVMIFEFTDLSAKAYSYEPHFEEVIGIWSTQPIENLPTHCLYKPMPTDPDVCAHELFSTLRDFDKAFVTQIWIERPPQTAPWLGVNDRLKRASSTE